MLSLGVNGRFPEIRMAHAFTTVLIKLKLQKTDSNTKTRSFKRGKEIWKIGKSTEAYLKKINFTFKDKVKVCRRFSVSEETRL